MIYIIILFFSIAMLCIAEKYKQNKKVRIIAFVLAGLSFFVVAAIRYNLGTDYSKRYVRDYIRIANGIDVLDLEFGFKFLIKICLLFTQDYVMLFAVTSAIIVFLTFYTIYKESPYPILSVIIYFCLGYYFHSLNITREFLAISVLLFSYKYLVNKKYIIFGICAIIAFLFHSTSLVIIISLLLCNKEVLNFKRTVILAILIAVFGQLLWPLIRDNIIINTRFSSYIGSMHDYGSLRKTDMIIYFAIYAIMYYLYKKSADNGRKERFYINMQACSILFLMASTSMFVLHRISFYFGIINLISIPYFIKKSNIELKKKNVIIILLMVILLVNIVKRNVFNDTDGVNPYQTIFTVENRLEKDVKRVLKNEEKRRNQLNNTSI